MRPFMAGRIGRLGVASGLASNPTFLNFRNGNAVLQSVRMGGEFFGEARLEVTR